MKKITIYQNEGCKELGDLYGLFFEDINHAADGGLYAELVQNRSFEFCEIDKKEYHGFTAWEKSGNCEWIIGEETPLNNENTHYAHVTAEAGAWIRNLGFNTGIYVEAGKKYDFSVYIKTAEESVDSPAKKNVIVSVIDENEKIYASAAITLNQAVDGQWKKYEVVLEADGTTAKGRLVLTFSQAGSYDLDMVSLFPQDTFKGRKNGMRRDIAEALSDMHPKFMRFPGGCLTHDGSMNDKDRNSLYRWRRTLGDIESRPTWRNNWGYNQTLGIGYYEYFCFCEDIGAKPLPVLPGGFNPHKGEGVPIEEIGEWVQETLDLIEFANGGTDTKMGSIRAKMGHPEPFHLEYLGIGNEEIGDGFFERYPYFHNAVREKYPEIKLINTAGPFAAGEGYEAGWNSAKKYGSDLVDEHYYSSPEWFLANMHHYEDYDEKGPKVFLGEYASWGNTYYNAIVEAAYMTHLERSKAVALACYAPMLANVDYVNWQPDMLWFDNHRIMKTPNYYVQKLFMENQGTKAVSFATEGLDEVIALVDEAGILGDIAISGNDIEGIIDDIKITTDKGNVDTVQSISITKDNALYTLAGVDSESYTLDFHFKRKEGRKGLKIFFGRKDDKNHILWEFGGWDNWDCNITSVSNGRNSTISHRIFQVGDMDYQLKLEVQGRRIKTYINGVLYNDTEDRLPQLEELYLTASVDENTGKTILKAVNLTGEEKTVEIHLEGAVKTKGIVNSLKNASLTAVNVLGEPENVSPTVEKIELNHNHTVFTFAPHSLSVLAFV